MNKWLPGAAAWHAARESAQVLASPKRLKQEFAVSTPLLSYHANQSAAGQANLAYKPLSQPDAQLVQDDAPTVE